MRTPIKYLADRFDVDYDISSEIAEQQDIRQVRAIELVGELWATGGLVLAALASATLSHSGLDVSTTSDYAPSQIFASSIEFASHLPQAVGIAGFLALSIEGIYISNVARRRGRELGQNDTTG